MYSADAYHPSERPTLKYRRLKVFNHLFMGSFPKTYMRTYEHTTIKFVVGIIHHLKVLARVWDVVQ